MSDRLARKPASNSYFFVEYSHDWPQQFEREAALLHSLLPGVLQEIHHIGSTSVPQLAAKPVIDLLPVVFEPAQLDELDSSLCAAGYESWGEYGLPGRRLFLKSADGCRPHNLHFYAAGHPDVERHVAFSRYLQAHPAIASEYARLKHEGFSKNPGDLDGYCNYKDGWIKATEPIAIMWYRNQH